MYNYLNWNEKKIDDLLPDEQCHPAHLTTIQLSGRQLILLWYTFCDDVDAFESMDDLV